MVFSKNNLLLFILLLWGLVSKGQSFSYSYIDPCTKATKSINVPSLNGNMPIVMNYYGQVKTFTPQELSNGTFANWANSVYSEYGKGNPCGQVAFTTITTNVLSVSNSVINNVVSLSSMLTTVTDAASNASSSVSSVAASSSAAAGGNTGNTGDNSSGSGDNNSGGGDNSGGGGSGSGDNSGSGGNSGGGSGSGSGSGGGGNNSNNTKTEEGNSKQSEQQKQEKVEEAKKEETKTTSQSTTKTAAKGSVKQDKPAIMLTGDIVGMQRAADRMQDAKLTTSYIRISGDKKKSLGVALDFTVKASIGNMSVFKSWMTTKTLRKHIDLVSNSISVLTNSYSNTLVYIRIDNVKSLTGLYGVGGMYGIMNKEPLTTIVAIGGGMYKGQLTKKVDAVFILAAVYVPYMKYYTENIFKSKPLVLPFFNINYKLSKTFRFGLTGGTTYSVTQSIINYQILFGMKATL
jgi:hypothetical protein